MAEANITGVSMAAVDTIQGVWGQCGCVAWLIDGADPYGLVTADDVERWTQQLNLALKHQVQQNPESTLDDVLESALDAAKLHDTDEHPSASVAMAQVTDAGIQTLLLGNAAVIVDATLYQDDRMETLRPELQYAVHQARCRGDYVGYLALDAEFQRAKRRMQNIDGGFWVAANMPEAAHHGGGLLFEDAQHVTLCNNRVVNAIRASHVPLEKIAQALITNPRGMLAELRYHQVQRNDHAGGLTAVTVAVPDTI